MSKIYLVYKNFTRYLSNIQNISLHNYVVTKIKELYKNFQPFQHSFPQQNIDNSLFFSFQHIILKSLNFYVEKTQAISLHNI